MTFRFEGGSAWWAPLPRDGQVVPDYPPTELGPFVLEVEPSEGPEWARRLAEPLTTNEITIGNWPTEGGREDE